MSFFTTVNSRSVDLTLDRLIMLMSPAGATAFLSSTIGPYLAKRGKERFQSEGDDVTGAWAPLKPATILIRQQSGFGAGPINRRTGELENWIVGDTGFSYPTGFGASMRFPGKRPTGELKKKVETAQKGRKAPSTVPRPVLGVNENDLLFLITAMELAIDKAIVR